MVPGVQRHLLDDAQLVAVLEAEPQQLNDILAAGGGVQDGVHLDRRQACCLGGGQPGHHVGEPVAAGDGREVIPVDAVQRNVDPVQPRRGQSGSPARKPDTVGGQRDFRTGPQSGRRRDHLFEVAGQQRLTAGKPHAGDTEPGHGDMQQPGQLVGPQQLLTGQPVQAFGRHAVTASQVAAIGQRHPQIGGGSAVRVQ